MAAVHHDGWRCMKHILTGVFIAGVEEVGIMVNDAKSCLAKQRLGSYCPRG